MAKKSNAVKKKSLKATPEQQKKLKDAEKFYLRKGFRSLSAVLNHLGMDQSNGRKAFLEIHKNKKALEHKKKIEEFIGFTAN